jgi:ElaB/YqjD/DUF883 family membrane-anchored ribosome-binding protein
VAIRVYKDARDWGVSRIDEVEEKISEHPAVSIAVALGVGYLAAKLLSSKK